MILRLGALQITAEDPYFVHLLPERPQNLIEVHAGNVELVHVSEEAPCLPLG